MRAIAKESATRSGPRCCNAESARISRYARVGAKSRRDGTGRMMRKMRPLQIRQVTLCLRVESLRCNSSRRLGASKARRNDKCCGLPGGGMWADRSGHDGAESHLLTTEYSSLVETLYCPCRSVLSGSRTFRSNHFLVYAVEVDI